MLFVLLSPQNNRRPVSYTHLDVYKRQSLKGLNSFDSIAISLVEGCFQHFDPLRFPEIYDSITPQDVLDFIREHICRSRAALSVIYPKED